MLLHDIDRKGVRVPETESQCFVFSWASAIQQHVCQYWRVLKKLPHVNMSILVTTLGNNAQVNIMILPLLLMPLDAAVAAAAQHYDACDSKKTPFSHFIR